MPVFDSSALLSVTEDEEGGPEVLRLMNAEPKSCFIHALNAAEVFYQISRVSDVLTARLRLDEFFERGLIERADLDLTFREDVAQLKADWRRISLADCCGVALARRLGREFVTSDHHELDPLAVANVARFHFFR